MFVYVCIAVLLLVPVAEAAAAAAAAAAAVCPLTGLAPQTLALPLHRCASADTGAGACCSTCYDIATALAVVSVNGSMAISILEPVLQGSNEANALSSISLCSFFSTFGNCSLEIEALYCGILCNADASRYFYVKDGVGYITLCEDYLDVLYSQCENVIVPLLLQKISSIFSTPEEFTRNLVLPIASSVVRLSSVNLTISSSGNATCFDGPPGGKLPAVPLCCDELTDTPAQCLEDPAVSMYASQIGRSVSTANCPVILAEPPTSATGDLASYPVGEPAPYLPASSPSPPPSAILISPSLPAASSPPPPHSGAPELSSLRSMTAILLVALVCLIRT